MPDNHVSLAGNATADPELRFTTNGSATCSFGLAVNRRWQNRQTQQWEEHTSFFQVIAWNDQATNVVNTVTKGMRVMVAGRLEQRSWETTEGEKRYVTEVIAEEIGPSLRWATANVTKTTSSNSTDNQGTYGPAPTTIPAASRAGAGVMSNPARSVPTMPDFDEEPF